MVKKEVLAQLIDDKKGAILRVLLKTSDELTLNEIAQQSNVSLTSTFRILQELVTMEVLARRVWKNSKVYRCHDNEKVEFLKTLFDEDIDGIAEFVKAAEGIAGVQNIIQYGNVKKGKANILLIGENINAAPLDPLKSSLKERGFEIGFLALTKEQYDKMVMMGLYSGEKKVLK